MILWGKKEFNDIPKLLKNDNINLEKIKIFEYIGDPGYAKGNNIGVSKVNAEFILISNPDIETLSDFLKNLNFGYLHL